jgi:hypothetical protein
MLFVGSQQSAISSQLVDLAIRRFGEQAATLEGNVKAFSDPTETTETTNSPTGEGKSQALPNSQTKGTQRSPEDT